MEANLSSLTQWLQQYQGHMLHIKKRELAPGMNTSTDSDETDLTLQAVTLRWRANSDADGYVGDQELVLHGPGYVESSHGSVRLPQQAYEIPVAEDFRFEAGTDICRIETKRAMYTIAPEKPH